ncbi:hypothetical protein OIU74_007278 [Salix koriyanagi]|uniref:Uncharacterized protein n=1 Tax=Salix koriyanagi TaxID=2511006 RepID=A0A9Q0U3D4_9ROSI|nr:hypothetical protein OIU74_007278 [Salix koriyanagi]
MMNRVTLMARMINPIGFLIGGSGFRCMKGRQSLTRSVKCCLRCFLSGDSNVGCLEDRGIPITISLHVFSTRVKC